MLPPIIPYVNMRTLMLVENMLIEKPNAATIDPAIATGRQPNLLTSEPATGAENKI